jgi:HAD superfamily hydrolase (TIGR01509 family)
MNARLHGARAILLDLDGTLVDTLSVMQTAWAAVREQHGVHLPFSAYQQHLGRPFDEIMQILGLTNAEQIHATYDAAATAVSDRATMFTGIEETLHTFASAGWVLGVVTSKPLHRAAPLLARLGSPFVVVRTPGAGRGKPAPDPLLLAVLDLGLDPAQATYVGDMGVDQESARRAGVRFIHAAWGYGEVDVEPSAVAHSPQDLLRVLGVKDQRLADAGRLG